MNEQKKTIAFVCFGLIMAGLAVAVNFATQPRESESAALIGTPFYPDFVSADQATSLKVTAMDTENAKLQSFQVTNKNGTWRIPSHHDYPAEAAERLAATATSTLGITRESRAGDYSGQHRQFGVLDPESFDPSDEEDYDLEAYGKRITLLDDTDEVLADFIIGRQQDEVDSDEFNIQFEEQESDKYYYVRRADEVQTYLVKLNIDLSTRFSDWIEPDLLQLQAADLRRIEIDNYELKEQGGNPLQGMRRIAKLQGDQFTLTRDDGMGAWTLDGIDEAKETVATDRVNEMVSVLDEMKIVGVRPKFQYQGQPLINADLEINEIPELQKDPALFNDLMLQMQDDLESKGFNFINSPDLQLVSEYGQVLAGTADGVKYQMQFGSKLEGTSEEIEIGFDSAATDQETGSTGADSGNEDTSEAESASEDTGENRYLMIRAFFDETLLGDRPVKPEPPTKPEQPEGYVPASQPDEETAEEPSDSTDAESADAAPGDPQEKPADDPVDDRDPKFIEYDLQLKDYEQQQTEYELGLTRFENETREFEEKTKAGQKRVAELNERFAAWFYVISADKLNVLQSKRVDVATPKEPEQPSDELPSDVIGRPDISFELPEEGSAVPENEEPTEEGQGGEETAGDDPPTGGDDGNEQPGSGDGQESGDDSSGNGGRSGTTNSVSGNDRPWFAAASV